MSQTQDLFIHGVKQLSAGNLKEAESCFLEALNLTPNCSEALVNLAYLQDERGDLEAAERTYQRALEAGADFFELHLNFGVMLAGMKRFDEAERSYIRARNVNPESSALWSDLGATYLALHRDNDAHTCFLKALELYPVNAKARFNLAYLHLIRGQYLEGWEHFESRDWYQRFQRSFAFPRWGGEDISNKRFIVCYEAGMGDVIQFSRYVNVLSEWGASHITLICHPPLKSLMATLEGCSLVLDFDEDTSNLSADYWTPLMSIPHHVKTDQNSIPAKIPYLTAEPELTRTWAERMPRGSFLVGLVWKGNPKFENDSERSLPNFRCLLPLWKVTGIDFVSLQKGQGEDEVSKEKTGQPAFNLGSQVGDFSDMAAILKSLDLVITVDTAVAHLAGALGKECWVLLPYCMTDWRWLREGDDTPWYPVGMRLFRQTQMGDWSGTINEVAAALASFADNLRAARLT